MQKLNVKMLDDFSVSVQNSTIDGKKSRTRKVWLLMAYLMYNRQRTVSQEELYRLLWGEEDEKDDPQNALRVLLHRARTLLNQFGDGVGQTMILRRKDGYQWSPEWEIQVDAEQFEQLCLQASASGSREEKTSLYRQALALYHTDFLEHLSGETWVRAISSRYHALFRDAVRQQVKLLEEAGLWEEILQLCRDALRLEPFSELLYFKVMQSLLKLERQQEVIELYKDVRQIFISNFGTLPSEDIRRLYYDAIKNVQEHTISIDTLCSQLQEEDKSEGALVCDYDFFRTVYHAIVRTIPRSGVPLHVALLTISGKDGQDPPSRSLEYIMNCLLQETRKSLRQGDIVTRCSLCQYALLLQLATYENSCMVCHRVIKAYSRKYPHSPVTVTFSVQAAEGTL